jgi:hypothetical protein
MSVFMSLMLNRVVAAMLILGFCSGLGSCRDCNDSCQRALHGHGYWSTRPGGQALAAEKADEQVEPASASGRELMTGLSRLRRLA